MQLHYRRAEPGAYKRGCKVLIDAEELNTTLDSYLAWCKLNHKAPQKKRFANILGVSVGTINNVVKGEFNGHKYTNKPHITRCISNDNFDYIQHTFS